MRMLFCSQNPLLKELGATKIIVELAEELERSGWSCKIASPEEIMPDQKQGRRFCIKLFSQRLKSYLLRYAHKFDIVEYDHVYLPYPRNEFCRQTLFVSRVTLLTHHLINLSIPLLRNYNSRLHSLLMGGVDKIRYQGILRRVQLTLQQADVINVANYDDQVELIKSDIPQDKIAVIPYGISRSRRLIFDAVSSEVPKGTKVVFVGAFGIRKGAADIPVILEDIYNEIAGVTFKLLGTGGNISDILPKFPKRLRSRIEIIPNFLSDELPGLLSDCSVGVFPSYAEGFGFGVLEMLAASIPVIAYDTPGPPMMLPSDYLVGLGDVKAMSLKAVKLLKAKEELSARRIWAKERSQEFSWEKIAQETIRIYTQHWQKITS